MKPFALDTVLNYRQRLEDIAKNNLAEARQKQQEAESIVKERSLAYETIVSRIDQAQRTGVEINELITLEEQYTYTKAMLSEAKDELQKRIEHVTKTQQELMKRSRERQVMDKLKERQNSAYKQYLAKKEAAALDEIAIIYHNK